MVKPLFLPLMSEYYHQFISGHKTEEFRLYGPRWNERTCIAGRDVLLSRGYGKKDRATGIIERFNVVRYDDLSIARRIVLKEIYGRKVYADKLIIAINIRDVKEVGK